MAELLPFRAETVGRTHGFDDRAPHDVMGLDEVRRWREIDPGTSLHVDLALPEDGEQPYVELARRLETWVASGRLLRDEEPTLTIHRMTFTDALGVERTISGVLGALEVTHGDASTVLAHERTTPKASTDRYDRDRRHRHQPSRPCGGRASGAGLTDRRRARQQAARGAHGRQRAAGSVAHRWEVVDEPGASRPSEKPSHRTTSSSRMAIIATALLGEFSRTTRVDSRCHPPSRSSVISPRISYRSRRSTGCTAGFPLMSSAPRSSADTDRTPGGTLTATNDAANLPSQIAERGQPCLITPGGNIEWLEARPEPLDGVRDLDGARLEHLLAAVAHEVDYLHDPVEAAELVLAGRRSAAVLILPVGMAEIMRTGRTGELMPPKSTFFSPKLPTGAVLRPLDGR